MSGELAGLLDLQIAWRRVKWDIENRVFIRDPYGVAMIELDLERWLGLCLEAVRRDRYSPKAMFVCDVPKGKGLVRPGSHLAYTDRLVFAACVGACLPSIHGALRWSQGLVDFSYRLAVDAGNPEWLRDRYIGWKEFQEKSLSAIDAGSSYVVFADITAFYENIDIAMLISDLKETGAPAPAVGQISACLNRWAQVSGRGIPQGQSPSDILAKVYVNNIDSVLRNMGYVHLRYVDDIRVFCRSEVESKMLLLELSKLLRKRGLSLQAAKSRICTADAARREIDGVTAAVRAVSQEFVEDVATETGVGDPYMSIKEADDILDDNPDEAPLEIIQRAYQTYIVERPNGLNPTIFRFLINRLGRQRDSFAAEHCLTLLEPYPEETPNILRYFRSIGPGEALESAITELMRSGELVYQYQIYELIQWFYGGTTRPPGLLLEFVRRVGFEGSSPRYLRTICRAFLGKFGTSADIERIASAYDDANDPSERAAIVCAIQRMERGRRNAFLARVENDGAQQALAARWVRNQG